MSDDTNPFYAPDRRPPKSQPKAGERLCEFIVGHARWLVELRDQGPYGVGLQFFENEECLRSLRFLTRQQAIMWAELERRAIERTS